MYYYLIATIIVIAIIFLLFWVWWYCYCNGKKNNDCKEVIHQNYVFYKPTSTQKNELVGMTFIDGTQSIKDYKFVFYNSPLDLTPSDYPGQFFIAWNTDAFTSLEEQVKKLEDDNTSLSAQITVLQSVRSKQINTANKNISALENTIQTLTEEKDKHLKQIQELELQNKDLSLDFNSKLTESINTRNSQVSDLQQMIDTLSVEKDELCKERDTIKEELIKCKQDVEELIQIGDELEKERDSLKQQLQKKTKEHIEQIKIVEAYKSICTEDVDTVEEILKLQSMISENEAVISNMEQLIDNLKEEIHFKDNQIEDLTRTNEEIIENNNKLVFDIDKLKHHLVSQSRIISELQSGNINNEIIQQITELNLIDKDIKESILAEQAQTRGLAKIGHILETSVASIYSLAPSSAFGEDDNEKIDSLVKQGSKVIIGVSISDDIKEKYKSVRFIDLADPVLYITLFKVLMSISSAVTIIVSTIREAKEIEKRFYPLNVNAVLFDEELDIFQILDKTGVVHIMDSIKDKVYNLIKLRGQRIIAHIVDNYVHQIVAEIPDLFPKYTALISNLLYRGSGVKLARALSGKIEIKDMNDDAKCIVYVAQPDSSLDLLDIKLLGDKFGINVITITLDYGNVDKDFECLHRLYDCGIRVFIGARSTFEVQYEAIRKLQELYSDVVVISEGSNLDMEKEHKIIRLLESDKVITERVLAHLNTIKVKDMNDEELNAEIAFVVTPNDYSNDSMNCIVIDEEDEINIDDLAEQFAQYDVIAFNATVSELFYDNIQYFPKEKLYVRYNDSCIHNRLMYKMKELDIDYNDVVPVSKDGKNAQIIEAIMYSSFILNMTHLSFDKIIEYSYFLRGPCESIELDKNGDRIDQSLAIYKIIRDDVKIECILPKLHYRDDTPACLINI